MDYKKEIIRMVTEMTDEDVLMRIRVLSVTGSLIHLSCEASVASRPEKLCLSCTATYFYKPRTA